MSSCACAFVLSIPVRAPWRSKFSGLFISLYKRDCQYPWKADDWQRQQGRLATYHQSTCDTPKRLNRKQFGPGNVRSDLGYGSGSESKSENEQQRETDARGFILPQQGDVVVYQGRWPTEDEAGVVESVRFVASRSSHIVDVNPLRRVSTDLFAVQRASKRPRMRWFDVAQVRVVTDAEYVVSQDAYRVIGARDGYAPVRQLSDAERNEANAEYRALQEWMRKVTAAVGFAGSIGLFVLSRGDVGVARAFGLGSCASFLYLIMLQRAVDTVERGTSSLASRLLGLRFMVPALPFIILSWLHAVYGGDGAGAGGLLPFLPGSGEGASVALSRIPRAEALAVVFGLLTYKVPILYQTAEEFVDGLAAIELGKTGMIGTLAALTARQIQRRRNSNSANTTNSETSQQNSSMSGASRPKPVLIFAGPSGVGKSTLIHRLLDENPDRLAYSISHTTRLPRNDEQNRVDYSFVTDADFARMVSANEFVEHAHVHGNSYGTSFAAVEDVLSDGRVCILDLDVQGIKTVRAKQSLDWDSRFVWIAPPSLAILEDRLRRRGTETEHTLNVRLQTAMREIEFAATTDVFDLIVVNDDFERAYIELRDYVSRLCREWFNDSTQQTR